MAAASGDADAFLALYDRWSPRVFGLVLKLVGDRDEAEDVLQEVMWEVWEKASRFEPRLGAAGSWMLMIARSRAVDRVRRRRREAGRVPSAPDLPDAGAGASGRGWTGVEPEMTRAMESLPSEQRDAVSLAFYYGLTREQIADVRRVPVGTVKTRIRAGVRRLREILEPAAAEA